MVGRDGEMEVFARAVDDVVNGHGRVVAVAAEAGRGKSRLVAEVVREVSAAGVAVAWGEAQNLGRTTSYLVWREYGAACSASTTTSTRACSALMSFGG